MPQIDSASLHIYRWAASNLLDLHQGRVWRAYCIYQLIYGMQCNFHFPIMLRFFVGVPILFFVYDEKKTRVSHPIVHLLMYGLALPLMVVIANGFTSICKK